MACCNARCYPRLITGDTIYRYIAGSDSWLRWPAPHDSNRVGLDVLLFWGALAAAAWQLRPWRSGEGSRVDAVLGISWALTLLGFLLVATCRASSRATNGWRFAWWLPRFSCWPAAPAASSAAGHCVRQCAGCGIAAGLATAGRYQVHYFRFIEHTGGTAHLTFRTGRVDPKSAALAAVLREREPGEAWIVSSQWWIC